MAQSYAAAKVIAQSDSKMNNALLVVTTHLFTAGPNPDSAFPR
jgi:hypothetical protein